MLESLISTYGYAAIFVGTAVEGETVLVLGGFLAHRGYLSLPWVMFWAFLGSLVADQAWFLLGRIKGPAVIAKRPTWQVKANKVAELVRRREILVALGFRFVYGTRTVTPMTLGAIGYSPWRFAVLNTIGAAVWSIGFGLLGALFGETATRLLGEVERYEAWVAGAIVALGLVAVIWTIVRRRAARG